MEWLDQVNKNSGALSAIFSGVVTVATVIYAWLTAKLVNETRRMREAQTEPSLHVVYRNREEWINLLDIAVRNIGLGAAYDVTFEIRAELRDGDKNDLVDSLGKLGCFEKGLVYLGPNQEFTSFWTNLMDGQASKLDTRVFIHCRYRSATGVRYENQCVLDLSEIKGISRIGEPPLLKIAKQLEAIAKDLNHLTTGFKRLRVDAFTQTDRDAERAEWETQRAELAERHKQVAEQSVSNLN